MNGGNEKLWLKYNISEYWLTTQNQFRHTQIIRFLILELMFLTVVAQVKDAILAPDFWFSYLARALPSSRQELGFRYRRAMPDIAANGTVKSGKLWYLALDA